MKVAIFDLDGTVRRSKTGTFVKDHNDQELIPGIKERMDSLREMKMPQRTF